MNNVLGDDYEVLGDYIKNNVPIKMLHKKCGNSYTALPRDILQKKGSCPICKESYGEKEIAKILSENEIPFERQFSFDDCKHIHRLKFDFKIEKDNNLILIEYDGEFHFKPIMGEDKFNKQIKNDKIKDEYCKDNNITLIRIPYTTKNIKKL